MLIMMARQIHANYGKLEGGRIFQYYLLGRIHNVSRFIIVGLGSEGWKWVKKVRGEYNSHVISECDGWMNWRR